MALVIEEDKQKEKAINTFDREGTFLVLAGPGTGKTYTISKRIKAIIENGTPAERILCLTFSDTASSEMKKGIEKMLNVPKSDVNIYTYHGFCMEIIKNHPEVFSIGENVKIITESMKKVFMKECIDERRAKYKDNDDFTTFKSEKSGPYFFIDKILNCIAEIKKYRLDKKKYYENLANNPDWIPLIEEKTENWKKQLIKNPDKPKPKVVSDAEKKVAQAEELWELYEAYRDKMKKKSLLDFGDMITMVLDEFDRDSDFVKEIASQYDYVIADEYQDTNVSQNEILFALAQNMPKKNVFVVGDDDQIIYTFQGARLDSVKNFITKLDVKDDDVICFKENRRSTAKILEVARQIVLQDEISLEKDSNFKRYNISKELTAVNQDLYDKNKDVRCLIYRDSLQERVHIVDEIKELVNSPNCPKDKKTGEKKLSEIAILARTNEELAEYANLLQANGIPYESKNGKKIFQIQSFMMMFLYMQFLCNSTYYNDSFFKMILSKPFNINEKDYEILYETRYFAPTFIDNMRRFKDLGYKYQRKNGKVVEFKDSEKIDNFIKVYDELKDIKQSTDLKNAVIAIGNKTGIFEYYFNCPVQRADNIAGLKTLVTQAENFMELEKVCTFEFFVKYIENLMLDDLKIFAEKAPVKQNAVQLYTYHGSKGMEFEYVYMPYLIHKQNNFESTLIPLSIYDDISKDSITGETLSKEQKDLIKKSNLVKLIYVAMTRAKHTLNLSYVQVRDDGKDALPLDLLTAKEVVDLINPKEYETEKTEIENYEDEVIKLLRACDRDYEKEFDIYLNDILEDKKYSPSAVNCYLGCSREYMYTYLFGLSPKADNADKAHFGTAVHAAYEYAVKYAIDNGEFPSKHDFIAEFENTLKVLPVTSELEMRRMLVDGAKMLGNVDEDGFCCYDALKNVPVSQLYKAEHEFNFDIDGAKFTGKIDRIDKLADGKYIIYDYKTGDRKDEKDICPDGGRYDYYCQMALYKHFLREELNCDYDDISTVFVFPRDYKKPFELKLTKEACQEVVSVFRQAISDIKAHKFEPKKNKAECGKWCPYKDSYCNLNVI